MNEYYTIQNVDLFKDEILNCWNEANSIRVIRKEGLPDLRFTYDSTIKANYECLKLSNWLGKTEDKNMNSNAIQALQQAAANRFYQNVAYANPLSNKTITLPDLNSTTYQLKSGSMISLVGLNDCIIKNGNELELIYNNNCKIVGSCKNNQDAKWDQEQILEYAKKINENFKQTPKENKMKELVTDFKHFLGEHKSTIYMVLLIVLADHFFLNGKLRGRIEALVGKGLTKLEDTLDSKKDA